MKKKKKKKLLCFISWFTSMSLISTVLSFLPALTVEASPIQGIDYVYVEVQRKYVKLDPINDEEAEIVGWYEMPSYGIIPETMDGYKIVGLGAFAFWCCDSIYGLKLPDTIRYIDRYSFGHCGNLDEINIPDTVHYIGDGAFEECTSLESIDLPDGITEIGESAFKLCSKLKSFTFPKGVTEIADNVLSFNSSLTSIELHSDIKKIGNFSFRDNPVIESLYIPDSVEEIGEEAFINCTNLKSIHLPEGWSEIADYMFYCCTSLENFEIKDSVTRIGNSAFYGCTSLGSLTIPDSVTYMGERSVGYTEGVSEWTYALVDGFTIYGSYGSTAENYAKDNNITFIDINALKNTSVINSDTVQVGDKVRISASARGGEAPYTYAYYYKRSCNSAWKVLGQEFGTNTSVAFIPTAEAEYDIKVVVRDNTGDESVKTFTVRAMEEMELTNVSVVGRKKLYLGSAIPMIGKAVGGSGGYTYAFYFKRSSNTNWKLLGEKFSTAASARFRPTAAGTYDIRIIVRDSKGKTSVLLFNSTVLEKKV